MRYSNQQKWKQPSKIRRSRDITHEERIKGQRKNMDLFIGVHGSIKNTPTFSIVFPCPHSLSFVRDRRWGANPPSLRRGEAPFGI
jgi:hypothetical protein